MLKESPWYAWKGKESSGILERFEFVSTLIKRDKITALMDMGTMEAKALK